MTYICIIVGVDILNVEIIRTEVEDVALIVRSHVFRLFESI